MNIHNVSMSMARDQKKLKELIYVIMRGFCTQVYVFVLTQELAAQKVLVLSGHHGKLHFESNRLIIDESGGFDDRPLAAMILPARELVRDTDSLLESKSQDLRPQSVLVAH